MSLDRAWIESHIPHKGRMCLLDSVITWTAETISCRSSDHRDPEHPLRAHGRLGVACGVEYAAQAMAVHGALLGAADLARQSRPPPAGYLAALREVRMRACRLDDVEGDLFSDATRLFGDRSTALYEFVLRSATEVLLSGRATVVLDPQKRPAP